MRGKILIVDSDETARDRLEAAIGQAPFDVQITAIPDDAINYVRKGKVDILLVDGDSVALDFLEQVAEERPDVVRILSAPVAHAPPGGGNGIRRVTKPCDPEVLHNVLRDAMQQATVNFTAHLCMTLRPTPPPSVAPAESPTQSRSEPAPTTLSRRELEVQELLIQGLGTAHIARKLSISVFTVRNHTKSIYEKLGIHSRRALVRPVPPI
ncbi:MAG TPA: response regulator transcription factor [Polyangiaceae bacterium]|nr:response regulator transcription factor [Polyangiaceae bacterium]